MGHNKKLSLLVLSLIVFTQSMLAGSFQSSPVPGAPNRSALKSNTHYSVALQFAAGVDSSMGCFTIDDDADLDEGFVLEHAITYKKKQKRILPAFTRFKRQFRELDPVSIYIESKETYSKPYFLSHLQHFLFRLTPF